MHMSPWKETIAVLSGVLRNAAFFSPRKTVMLLHLSWGICCREPMETNPHAFGFTECCCTQCSCTSSWCSAFAASCHYARSLVIDCLSFLSYITALCAQERKIDVQLDRKVESSSTRRVSTLVPPAIRRSEVRWRRERWHRWDTWQRLKLRSLKVDQARTAIHYVHHWSLVLSYVALYSASQLAVRHAHL